MNIWEAARTGALKAALLFLNEGANPNIGEISYGFTPLMMTAWGGSSRHLEVAKLLVARGADVNVKSHNYLDPEEGEKTALMLAAENKNPESLDIMEFLIGNGADVHARDNKGRTVLMHAARRGNVEAIQLLISQGVAVNAQDKSGNTALKYVKPGYGLAAYNLLREEMQKRSSTTDASTLPEAPVEEGQKEGTTPGIPRLPE